MRSLPKFFKTTLLGGLFVLLPLILLYLLLSELLQVVVALATPIADLFPKGTFDQVKMPVVIGIILIVGASFLFGLALRSASLRRLGLWIEGVLLDKLPLYNATKRLGRGLVGAQENSAFRSGIFSSANGEKEIVYVIEDHGDGQMTILCPFAPASFAGSVKIVSADRIEVLDTSFGDASRVIAHWGVGAKELLGKKSTEERRMK
jgi:uncharacterized membrane protein